MARTPRYKKYNTYLDYQNDDLFPRIKVPRDVDHIGLGREEADALLYFIHLGDDKAEQEAWHLLSRACAARIKNLNGNFNRIREKFRGIKKKVKGGKSVPQYDEATGAIKGRVYKLYWNMSWAELLEYDIEVTARVGQTAEEHQRVQFFIRIYKQHPEEPTLRDAVLAAGLDPEDFEIDLDA